MFICYYIYCCNIIYYYLQLRKFQFSVLMCLRSQKKNLLWIACEGEKNLPMAGLRGVVDVGWLAHSLAHLHAACFASCSVAFVIHVVCGEGIHFAAVSRSWPTCVCVCVCVFVCVCLFTFLLHRVRYPLAQRFAVAKRVHFSIYKYRIYIYIYIYKYYNISYIYIYVYIIYIGFIYIICMWYVILGYKVVYYERERNILWNVRDYIYVTYIMYIYI